MNYKDIIDVIPYSKYPLYNFVLSQAVETKKCLSQKLWVKQYDSDLLWIMNEKLINITYYIADILFTDFL